jgi:hypothetical protein
MRTNTSVTYTDAALTPPPPLQGLETDRPGASAPRLFPSPAEVPGAGGRRARRVRAVDGAGAGAVPRHLRPYLPAAGSTLKSSGAAGDYRTIRELVGGW